MVISIRCGVHKIVLFFFIKFEFEIRKNDGWGHFFFLFGINLLYIYNCCNNCICFLIKKKRKKIIV